MFQGYNYDLRISRFKNTLLIEYIFHGVVKGVSLIIIKSWDSQ